MNLIEYLQSKSLPVAINAEGTWQTLMDLFYGICDNSRSYAKIIEVVYDTISDEAGERAAEYVIFAAMFAHYHYQVRNGGHYQYFDNGYASEHTQGFFADHRDIGLHLKLISLAEKFNFPHKDKMLNIMNQFKDEIEEYLAHVENKDDNFGIDEGVFEETHDAYLSESLDTDNYALENFREEMDEFFDNVFFVEKPSNGQWEFF